MANDRKDVPGHSDVAIQGEFEVNAPGFCDPGTPDNSNGSLTCTRDAILRAIASRPLAFEPWTRPLYSNTGFDLLGWATAEAAQRDTQALRIQMSDGSDEKNISITLEDLLQRDVFDPLDMRNTSFLLSPEKKENAAVPSKGVPNMIDWDFTSVFNPYYSLCS